MKRAISVIAFQILASFFLFTFNSCYAQNNNVLLRDSALNVFIDCPACDQVYIKTEISFVNYVRDVTNADVYILITEQTTGSIGTAYYLSFTGQHNFIGKNDTLTYIANNINTEDDTRKGLAQRLKLGLIPYLYNTSLADELILSFKHSNEDTTLNARDKWRGWLFNSSINGFISGQESAKTTSVAGSLSAGKVTQEWKFNTSFNVNYNESFFKIGDAVISNYAKGNNFYTLLVKSLTNHSSIGGNVYILSSTYTNKKYSALLAPAFEFNVFPYSIAYQKQFRFLYTVFQEHVKYADTTIYDEIEQKLYGESLSITLELKQKWGSLNSSIHGSHYFHDFTKNNLSFINNFYIRVHKGLSVQLTGQISLIHDQLFLPKAGSTTEEILLQRRQLATTYSYSGSIGISYVFGSMYSNVVNQRF